jgi:hypothetical protein
MLKVRTRMCNREDCRLWVDYPEIGNCLGRNWKDHGLTETGEIMGMSKQRVQYIEKRAIGKLMGMTQGVRFVQGKEVVGRMSKKKGGKKCKPAK